MLQVADELFGGNVCASSAFEVVDERCSATEDFTAPDARNLLVGGMVLDGLLVSYEAPGSVW